MRRKRQSPRLSAAVLWADARKHGNGGADDKEIDADVILAAQAMLFTGLGDRLVVATYNARHLSRYVDAHHWDSISRSQVRQRLIQGYRIPTLHTSALYDSSEHADISLIVLDNRAEDVRVLGKVSLRESRHHAASTRVVDLQAYFIANCDDPADPVVFHECVNRLRSSG